MAPHYCWNKMQTPQYGLSIVHDLAPANSPNSSPNTDLFTSLVPAMRVCHLSLEQTKLPPTSGPLHLFSMPTTATPSSLFYSLNLSLNAISSIV